MCPVDKNEVSVNLEMGEGTGQARTQHLLCFEHGQERELGNQACNGEPLGPG